MNYEFWAFKTVTKKNGKLVSGEYEWKPGLNVGEFDVFLPNHPLHATIHVRVLRFKVRKSNILKKRVNSTCTYLTVREVHLPDFCYREAMSDHEYTVDTSTHNEFTTLSGMTKKDLKCIAKQLKIKGYYDMNKRTLTMAVEKRYPGETSDSRPQ